MKLLISLLALLCYFHCGCGTQIMHRVICYYDSESRFRSGCAQLPRQDLEYALQFCSHLIYGYAGLNRNYELTSLHDGDMYHYREITSMKWKFPQLKIFLSLGGDKDIDEEDPEKYIHFLEGGKQLYQNFIQSSIYLLKTNGFDGLDLAFQFPRNKPRKVHSQLGMFWKKFKKLFTGDFIVDTEADLHKQQFTKFVRDLKHAFNIAGLSTTLTVLPNVNSTWYFDIPKIKNEFVYVNLFAFDFLTPERNPDEADFTAPIYLKGCANRLPHYNIEYQVNYWIQNGCPAHQLNLGIATYARTWKLTTDSGLTGRPVVAATEGAGEVGLQSKIAGIMSWPEVCAKVGSSSLIKVTDIKRKYGNYAFRPADEYNEHGLWISYDDPDFAFVKAKYATLKELGGFAICDLSYDDFRGFCTGVKFPILRSVL